MNQSTMNHRPATSIFSGPHKTLADAWYGLALSGDAKARAAMFHDDAVFESPVVHTPQRGKAMTVLYLDAAAQVFGASDFQYVGEWAGDHSIILEFKCQMDGVAMNGIDMISFNDQGLITHFKVMVRPLKAINLLHQKMGELLLKR
jgi:SnoaL-like domain